MVRVLASYNDSNTADEGWQWHSGQPKGVESVQKVVRYRLYEQSYSNFPIRCQGIHSDHKLGGVFFGNTFRHSLDLVFLEIVLVILITKIIYYLLKPLKQPRIVSEILGGLFVGPSLLGRSDKFRRYLLHANVDFVTKNIGIMGFMLFLFLTGVKMDLTFVKRVGKKHYYVSLIGVIAPTLLSFLIGVYFQNSMDDNLSQYSSLGSIAASLGITSFPVISLILTELNLLNSDLGQYAMSVSLISDAIGLQAIVAFEAAKQGQRHASGAVFYLISSVILAGFVFTVISRLMVWIVENLPKGRPVGEGVVVGILVGVMSLGFLTDMFGIAIANGPLWLGLVIPDGPPLGSALVDRCQTLTMEIFMPFGFAMVGLYTDVSAMVDAGFSALTPLLAMVVTGYVMKLLATALTAYFFKSTLREGLTIGLIMSTRGQVELCLYVHYLNKQILSKSTFALLVIMTTVVTATFTPLISLLYDPRSTYMVNKRRTIQHTPPSTELRMVLCAPDQLSAAGFISLLDFSNPTLTNPYSIHALHLVELVGRATPLFIDHDKKDLDESYKNNMAGHEAVHIYNALRKFQESREEYVNLHAYTSLAPRNTMYQDVCELAFVHQTALIVLPFCKRGVDGYSEMPRHWFLPSVTADVLNSAPCSVAIFYDKTQFRNPLKCSRDSNGDKVSKFVVLFLGGADSREALAYADRMTGKPDITLTVVRFLSHSHDGVNEIEKKVDDGVVTWFRVKNESDRRVEYREVAVTNGAEILSAIHATSDYDNYDLWITGRNGGIKPELLQGFSQLMNVNNELGLIGDYITSDDFVGDASVLVIQQQILREDRVRKKGFFGS